MFKCSTEAWSERGKGLMESMPRQNPGPQKSVRVLLFDFNEARISLKRTAEGSTCLEKKSIQMSHSIIGSKSEIAVAL